MKNKNKYRLNVGIIIANEEGKLWLGKNVHNTYWQFPQGGIDANENPREAMFRELFEECGLSSNDVIVISETKKWFSYNFPKYMKKNDNEYIGQKQKWFLLILKNKNAEFILDNANEFSAWKWVNYWYPLRSVVSFKRDVYRKVLVEFIHHYIKYLQGKK